MISVTNENKNTAVDLSLESRDIDLTWEEATMTWDEAEGTWGSPLRPISLEDKNALTLSLETK